LEAVSRRKNVAGKRGKVVGGNRMQA